MRSRVLNLVVMLSRMDFNDEVVSVIFTKADIADALRGLSIDPKPALVDTAFNELANRMHDAAVNHLTDMVDDSVCHALDVLDYDADNINREEAA